MLRVVHPGVYLVGAILPAGADRLAAVYACWPTAVLSHRSAAEEWELIAKRDSFALQITAPGWRRRGPRGIYVHRTASLPPDEVDQIDGVPVTSAARAVFDLASQAPAWEVAAAYEEGLINGLFDRDQMIKMAMRHKGRRGISKIRFLIDRDAPPSVTIERAHRTLLELIRSSDLPPPKTEFKIDGKPADIAWPEAKLVVEMDGGAFHNTVGRIERDKLRDGERAAIGWLTIRVTWNELTKRPTALISRIARTYAIRTAAPTRS
jgi:very-short-patch-repair endonuclease